MRANTLFNVIQATLLFASTLAAPIHNQLLGNLLSSAESNGLASEESLWCHKLGRKTDRADLITAVNVFCSTHNGAQADIDHPLEFTMKIPKHKLAVDLMVKVHTDNVVVGILGPDCGKLFRRVIDGCNTGGENGKLGGSFFTQGVEFWVNPRL